MKISDLQAIDVHAHFGLCVRDKYREYDRFMSGDLDTVLDRAKKARTVLTIVSPLRSLMPRGRTDPIGGNEEASRLIAKTKGVMQWVVVNPLMPETLRQAEEMLKLPYCAGIKIHPEEHQYPIIDEGRKIFEFAAAHKAIVITHSGEQNSMPEDFVRFANDFSEVTLILAHLGCGWDNDPTHQVRAIQSSKHGNVYTDTSSAVNITPKLLEWAVGEIGAERILYGTDSMLYFAPMQRARIDYADIDDHQKKLILRDNAEKLFKISELGLLNRD